MELQSAQLIAGTASSILFASGTLGMLIKAWRTKDMESYSMSMLILNNIGNLVYWLYVVSLPFGPVWVLHGFYTVSTLWMLVWFLLHRHRPATTQRIAATARRITQTIELPRFVAER